MKKICLLISLIAVLGCSETRSQTLEVSGKIETATVKEGINFTNNLRPRYVVGAPMPRYTLSARMKHYGVPGVSVAVIKDGRIIDAKGYGVLQAGKPETVDADTLFSAGSVSKIATAAMIMRMHDQGQVDLDAPVSEALKSWKLPESELGGSDDITLRHILSHTAGFNVHGFPDFQPGKKLPTVYDTLNGAA